MNGDVTCRVTAALHLSLFVLDLRAKLLSLVFSRRSDHLGSAFRYLLHFVLVCNRKTSGICCLMFRLIEMGLTAFTPTNKQHEKSLHVRDTNLQQKHGKTNLPRVLTGHSHQVETLLQMLALHLRRRSSSFLASSSDSRYFAAC